MILCDLVSILARCWYFDRAGPVRIKIAEIVGDGLKVLLTQICGLVQADKEVSWCDTALGGLLRNHEEVKTDVGVIILNEDSIDD